MGNLKDILWSIFMWVLIILAFGLSYMELHEGFSDADKPMDFDIRRLYLAAGVLSVIGSLLIIGIVVCVWGPETTDGKEKSGAMVFKALIQIFPPIMTLILGFYFGRQDNAKPPELQISKITAPEKVKKGEKITISTTAFGGKAPYDYTLSFLPEKGMPPTSTKQTKNGTIEAQVDIPPSIEDKQITLVIKVTDDEEKSQEKTKKLTVE